MRTIGDLQLLKRTHRSVVLCLLRYQPGLSRARLSQQCGLTKSACNPHVVVGRQSCSDHPALLATATRTAAHYAQSGGFTAPTVRVGRYGILAAAVAAAAVAWHHHHLRPLQQHQGPAFTDLEPA